MESYRHATYRYSTGQGFNANVDVPKIAEDVASYKIHPLYTDLEQPSFRVELKREADRISMQLESAARQMRNLGRDSSAEKKINVLKNMLEVIKVLTLNYGVNYIIKSDLEKLYTLKGSPSFDAYVKKILNKKRVKPGKSMRLFDQFGRRITAAQTETFKKEEKAAGLNGLSGTGQSSMMSILAVALLFYLFAWVYFKK